jgi:hypothetical protein
MGHISAEIDRRSGSVSVEIKPFSYLLFVHVYFDISWAQIGTIIIHQSF